MKPEIIIIQISKEDFKKMLNEEMQSMFEKYLTQAIFQDEIFDVYEAAKFIKKEVNTVYNYTSLKKIPFIKKFGSLYFEKSKLIKWILENENPEE